MREKLLLPWMIDDPNILIKYGIAMILQMHRSIGCGELCRDRRGRSAILGQF
jgi:hypothetical protein